MDTASWQIEISFLQDGTVCKEILAEAFHDFKVNAMSGVGILEAKAVESGENVGIFFPSFSMEHAARYATIAQK